MICKILYVSISYLAIRYSSLIENHMLSDGAIFLGTVVCIKCLEIVFVLPTSQVPS